MADDGDAYQLAYEANLRTFDEQRMTLAEIRQRANNLLATAFVAGGLIASIIFTSERAKDVTKPGLAGISMAGLGMLAVFVFTALIWRAADGWKFNVNGYSMIPYIDQGSEAARLQRSQAINMGPEIEDNRTKLKGLLSMYNTGLLAMLVQIAGLFLLIGDLAHV